MPRRRPAQLHVNHERWLVSYADFITLLFAFFVVMYSISQVSESKYQLLSATLAEVFDAPPGARPTQVDLPSERSEQGELAALGERISERFPDLVGDEMLAVRANEHWLQVQLKDSILFGSGSAELSAQAQQIFSDMAGLLADSDNPVQIEGHTDNRPINNLRFPSNWELSSARASAIVKLMAEAGVAPARLSAVGYGEYQPRASNATEQGRAENRRVTLMIARDAIERPETELHSSPLHANKQGNKPKLSGRQLSDGAQSPQAPQQEADSSEEEKVIGAVQLESGGLLFSSDPDLPRKR